MITAHLNNKSLKLNFKFLSKRLKTYLFGFGIGTCFGINFIANEIFAL